MERGGHQRLGQHRLQGGRHRSPGRHQGQELPPLLHQGVGHRHDDLAGQGAGQRLDRGHGPVPRGGHDHEVGRRAVLVGRPGDGQGVVGPRPDQAGGHAAARSASRDPRTTSSPAAARRTASPRPAGPVPPRIPIRMGHTLGTAAPGTRHRRRRRRRSARAGHRAGRTPRTGAGSTLSAHGTPRGQAHPGHRRADRRLARLRRGPVGPAGGRRGGAERRRTRASRSPGARPASCPVEAEVLEIDVTEPGQVAAAAAQLGRAVGPARRPAPRHRLRPARVPRRRHLPGRLGAGPGGPPRVGLLAQGPGRGLPSAAGGGRDRRPPRRLGGRPRLRRHRGLAGLRLDGRVEGRTRVARPLPGP